MDYGYIRDPFDERDYSATDILSNVALPKEVDLTGLLPHTLIQGSAPSCVGFAPAHQIWMEERYRGLRNSIPSPRYIYTMARLMYGPELTLRGTYPRLAFKGVAKYGCPPESKFPYSSKADVLNTPPSYSAIRFASSRIGLKYYRIKDNFSYNIRKALAEGHPVTIGTDVTQQIRDYKVGDIITEPLSGEKISGGHMMCLAGYKRNYFICVNSWASKPRLLLHESFIEWSKSGDFYVVTGWEDVG